MALYLKSSEKTKDGSDFFLFIYFTKKHNMQIKLNYRRILNKNAC